MYRDIITYQLADNITKEHLIKVAQEVHSNWMKDQAGFISWEIHENKDGSFTDIVTWESEEAVKKSHDNMGNISNSREWFACYKEGTIGSKFITQVAKF